MDSFHACPLIPNTRLVPNGLQACADWEPTPPTSPLSYGRSSSPPPYSPSSYDHRYMSHDLRECVHARLLCQERSAELHALLVNLDGQCKRSQCRCAGSAWCRTKSFLKRALTFGSRRKSQRSVRKQGPEPDSPFESRDFPSPAKELQAVPDAPELPPNHPPISELAATSLTAYHPFPKSHAFHRLPTTYIRDVGYGHPGYDVHPSMYAVFHMAPSYPKEPVLGHVKLLAQPPVPGSLGPMPYSQPSSTFFAGGSASMCQYTAPTPSSGFLASPQSSTSSDVSQFTTAGGYGGPLYTPHITHSPIEITHENGNAVSWHQNSGDSATTLAELPNSSPLPELDGTQPPQQEQVHEGSVPFIAIPMLPGRPSGEASETGRLDGGAKPVSDRSRIRTMMGAGRLPTVVGSDFVRLDSPTLTSARRAWPQPCTTEARRPSRDSSASDLIHPQIPDTTPSAEPPTHPPASRFSELPSRQRVETANQDQSPRRRSRAQRPPAPGVACCPHCGYYPAKGPDQRKKLTRHWLTDKHRKNTGQEVTGVRHTCPVCARTYNRADNMQGHVKAHHGVEQGAGGAKGRKQPWRTVAPGQVPGGVQEGAWWI